MKLITAAVIVMAAQWALASVQVPFTLDAHDYVVRYCVQAHFSNGTISQPLCTAEWGKILPYETSNGPSDTRHPFQTIEECWQNIEQTSQKYSKHLERDTAGRYHVAGFDPAKVIGIQEEYFECVSLSAEQHAINASANENNVWNVHIYPIHSSGIGYHLINLFTTQAECEAFLAKTPPLDSGFSYSCEPGTGID